MHCSTSTPNSTIPSTSDEILTFRYVWPLKITKRLINTGEKAILHVSPPFCTAYNGCQFTWLLRMCDEHVLEMANLDLFNDEINTNSSRVNVTLYYKNGPTTDITLNSATIFVTNSNGKKILKDTKLDGQEYTLGSGWSPTSLGNFDSWKDFSDYVHNNVGIHISVCVELKIKSSWFQPLNYLPSLESVNSKLEILCEKILKEIFTGQLCVPDSDIFDKEKDKFAYHRHVFYFACQEVEKRLDENIKNELSTVTVQTVFAHIYFNHVIMAETACFEDFVDILEASIAVHFPSLKRECERFICREVMVESADVDFVKKMLLLAERFQLLVLKMVSAGALVDKLILANDTAENASHTIRQELLQIAEQIAPSDESDSDDDSCDEKTDLVHSVVDQLEVLAKHIKKVSLSASCGNLNVIPGKITPSPGFFAAPLPLKESDISNAGQFPSQGRRSSLKTSRELLNFNNTSFVDSDGSSLNNSPNLNNYNPRRRSIMFSMQSFADEDEEDDYDEGDEGDESGVGSSNEQETLQNSSNIEDSVRTEITHFAVHVGR